MGCGCSSRARALEARTGIPAAVWHFSLGIVALGAASYMASTNRPAIAVGFGAGALYAFKLGFAA